MTDDLECVDFAPPRSPATLEHDGGRLFDDDSQDFANFGGGDDADDDADDAPTPAGKLDGGKYGMGGRIDDALDASTNETSFVLGGFLLTLSAIALFAFGPRPPTES